MHLTKEKTEYYDRLPRYDPFYHYVRSLGHARRLHLRPKLHLADQSPSAASVA